MLTDRSDIVVGVIRIITIVHVDFQDETWAAVPSIQWILVEPGIAIVVACSCVLRPVIQKLTPRGLFSSMRSIKSIKYSLKRSQLTDVESQKPRSGNFGRLEDDHIELVPQKAMSKAEAGVIRKDSNVGWMIGEHDGVVRMPERTLGGHRDVVSGRQRVE